MLVHLRWPVSLSPSWGESRFLVGHESEIYQFESAVAKRQILGFDVSVSVSLTMQPLESLHNWHDLNFCGTLTISWLFRLLYSWLDGFKEGLTQFFHHYHVGGVDLFAFPHNTSLITAFNQLNHSFVREFLEGLDLSAIILFILRCQILRKG